MIEQDTILYVDNRKIYEYVLRTSKEFIEKELQIKDELERYLHQIKMEHNI